MEKKKVQWWSPAELKKMGIAILGMLIYSAGMNLFIVPVDLYSGGSMGICQLIRFALVDFLGLPLNQFNITGIVYYMINVPIFILAFRHMGRYFFMRTLLCTSAITLFMSVIPVPAQPILADDLMATCIIGGIITGAGSGLTLRMGSSGGGFEILGLYIIKKRGHFSIGRMNMMVNLGVYTVCLFLFDVSTVIYSIIFACVAGFAVDKVHTQNINMEVLIITKEAVKEIEEDILGYLGRGVTQWNAKGAYTNADTTILLTVLSKYEVPRLKRIVHAHSPEAFVIVKEGADIDGNYVKKLEG